MDGFASLALAVYGGLAFLAFVVFGLISVREQEPRAARISLALAVVILLNCGLVVLFPSPVPLIFVLAISGGLIAAAAAFVVPQRAEPVGGGRPSRRVDERDIMFARGRLVPGSPEHEAYYALRPQHLLGDDLTRSLPGLLSPDAEHADEIVFAAAEASFDLTEAVRH